MNVKKALVITVLLLALELGKRQAAAAEARAETGS
jgi:hypothetical protein